MRAAQRTNRGLRKPVGSGDACLDHNEDKRLAYQAVTNALKCGTLIRQPCEACGGNDAEAHHEDYSKPLQVRWLCRKDHLARHGRTAHEKTYVRTRARANEVAKADSLSMAQTLRDEMDRQGLTQRELARMAGVTQPIVHRWFSAGFKTIGSVRLAADALNVKFTYGFEPLPRRQSSRVA